MRYLFFASLLFISIEGISQEQLSLNGYLTSSISDWEVKNILERGNAVSYKEYRSPWLREVEFRGRSNDFNISMEDFRLRFSPLNPGEVKANKRYFEIMGDLNDLEYQRKLGVVLRSRYQNMIDHYFLSSKRDLLEEKEQILQRTADIILQQRSGTDDFVKVDKALLQVQLSELKLATELRKIDLIIEDETGMTGTIDWNAVTLITAPSALALIQATSNVNNINLAYGQKQLELRNQRYEIERKEAFRNIGYLQAEYDIDRGNEFNEHAGYQLGIQIPLVNPDKPDLARRKIELLEDQADAREEESDINLQSKLLKLELESTAQHINLLSEKLVRVDELIEERSGSIASDLKGWIELLDYRFYIKDQINDEQRELYYSYISYLENAGLLSQLPLRNYLIEGTPELN